ncbi:hypothetical protein KP509_21G010000 [Ceratopteris richardii]|uniref:JmjC domain-containing protein n=1 Tax=Ceratopteris richardii TaxID=49495 RepID=A0A8T2SAQ4_CERRI|nr:hypothetical protein KP509_21G010000 [Ceratopteris richardii]
MANLNRSLLMQASDFSYVNATGDVLGCCQNKSRRTMGGCMPPLKAGCRNARHGNYCHPSPSPPTTLVSSHPRTRSTPLSSVFDTDGPKAKFNTRRQQLGHSTGKRSKASVQSLAQKLVWQSGESYTLEQFEAKAKQFARARLKTTKDLSPYVIESLFWKAATDRTITVEYGNDIPGSAFGDPSQFSLEASFNRGKRKRSSDVEDQGYSFHQHAFKELRTRDSENEKDIDYISPQHGRPEIVSSRNISSGMKCSSFPIIEKLRPRRKAGISVDDAFTGSELTNSFWNMKVLPRAPGSLLRYMPDEVPGVTSPMVYIGMLFSWFAWHVEDHELHSLNYLHTGAPKTWYAVPGDAAPALEEVVRVYGYGNSIDTRAAFTLLGEKTTVMSPEVLLAAGVPCCRLVQNAGDFVVTFPRSYHQGFSHGFNCGEAANFASPAWLEVAKDAATRRAAMDCLPMLSHQQLLYLLALSFPLRAPLCLASESRSSRSKDAVSSSGEEAVKIIFTNDVAHNNRLLGLLADSGVSGFVFVRDGANFSAVSTEQSSVSKPVVGNNLKTIGLMHTILPEDASEAENKSKDERSIEYHSFSTLGSECYKKAQNADTNTITTMFRWGTFPCAACGLLCYPSIAVVQPLSCTKEDYASFQDIRNDENNNLSTLYLEEGPKSDPGHLAPFFTMNDENIRSDFVGGLIPGDILYCATVHCEPKEDALHFEIGRKERGDSEQQHGPEERPASASLEDHHMNKVSKDAVTKLTQVRGCSELKLFLETDQATRSASGNVSDACLLKDQILTNVSQDYDKSAERKNLDWHPSGSVFEGREKFFKPGNFFLMNNMKDTDCKASKDKEHDTLAVVYASNSRHPYLCESTGRSMDVNMQNGSISMCFHSDLSSMQSDKIGTLLDVKWHSVKEEGTYIPSLHSDTLLRSSELNHARAPEGDGKLICDESLLSAGDCSFMATEPESELDLYHPTDRLPGCNMGMSQNECRFSSLASKSSLSIEKDDRMLNLEDRQASPDIVKASDYFTGLEETSLVSVPLHSPNMGRCGEGSTDAPYPTLCSAFCADTSESRTNICHDSCCPLEVTIADKNLNLLESSKQPDFRRASCQADCYSDRINDNTCDLSPVSRTNLSDQFSGSGRQNQIRRVDIDSSAKQSSPLKSLKVLDCKTSGKHSDSVSINETINAFSDAKFGFDMNWVDIDGRCRSTLSLLEENSCHEIDKSVLMNKGGNSGKNAVNDVDISIRDHSFNKTPSNPSILPFSSNTFEPRFLCLEHALEAHHRLRKLECDSQMLIICHSV